MDNKEYFKKEHLEHIRHSVAHLLAAAVMKLWPDTKRTIGPAIEDGFYFDFEFRQPITEKDLPKIEKEMRRILPSWDEFTRYELTAEEAKKEYPNNSYKHELIDEFTKDGQKVSFYKSGDYWDLCRGGHVAHMRQEIKPDAFKLTKVAGAYWRGNEKNKMLTRIYGVAFETKEELDKYLEMLAEAANRDHKKIGKDLKLFTFSPLVGLGLPLFMPKGNIIKTELEKFIRQEKEQLGYRFVSIPHIARIELYEKSGHLGKYDAMMPIMTDDEGSQFVLKAMNCPHHFEIYNAELHSYRDLPLRLAENTTVYRNEKSGELSGLVRVRSITQDDTHHFVRHDQIKEELKMILGLMNKIYKTFGFKDYTVQVSVRGPNNREKYFGGDELWKESEQILIEAVKNWGQPFVVREGEAAFYGPKIDIMVKDSLGRQWQLTTVQLDFNQPENFHMRYIGRDGKEYPPAVLHVAILGAIERFMGILIEHYAGAFPLWLSPVQVIILPISSKQKKYAKQVAKELGLQISDLRLQIDDRDESVGKKIREASLQKIPYQIIVGGKEVKSKKIAVRTRAGKDLGKMSLKKFAEKIATEIEKKK